MYMILILLIENLVLRVAIPSRGFYPRDCGVHHSGARYILSGQSRHPFCVYMGKTFRINPLNQV